MRPAAEQMAEALATVNFNAPAIRVIQNVDAAFCDSPEQIRANLVSQMYSAVLWTDCVQTLVAEGVDRVVECGPGRVLAGLNRRIDKSITSFNINSLDSVSSVSAELLG